MMWFVYEHHVLTAN